LNVPDFYPPGTLGSLVDCNHNVITMYLVGIWALAPSATQGCDEGDGGSLADYVDSVVEQSSGDGDVGPGVPEFGDIWEADRSARRHLFLSA
jgi:hypothetical protein